MLRIIVLFLPHIFSDQAPHRYTASLNMVRELNQVRNQLELPMKVRIGIYPQLWYAEHRVNIVFYGDSSVIRMSQKTHDFIKAWNKEMRVALFAHELGHGISKSETMRGIMLHPNSVDSMLMLDQARADSVAISLTSSEIMIRVLRELEDPLFDIRKRAILWNVLHGRIAHPPRWIYCLNCRK